MKKIINLMAAVFLSLLFLTACKKNNDAPPPAPAVISSILPNNGPRTTIVEINGSGFGSNPAALTVKFNGVAAIVNSITENKIVAVVPDKADSGPVSIEKGGSNTTGPIFNYTWITTVSTLAGSTAGYANGNGINAKFDNPSYITTDAIGNFYITDSDNNRIRKITPAGVVSTLAGSTSGYLDGNGTNAKFSWPQGITIDAIGNIYVSDAGNNRIRKITPAGVVSTLAGSTLGYADGNGSNAKFVGPLGITVDANGNIYVSDAGNKRIRKITPAGVVSTLAGSTLGYADGNGSNARFYNPDGITVNANGNIYVSDDPRIRKITQGDVVSTVAGSTWGYADGNSTIAKFNQPSGIAVDAKGIIYVCDYINHRIRKITPAGKVSTLAGSIAGYEDGNGANAKFTNPIGITIDVNGIIYVVDYGNHRIRRITIE